MNTSSTVLAVEGMVLRRMGATPYTFEIPALYLEHGHRYCLFGPSGSGKSTALDMLSMIRRPDAAHVFALRTNAHNNTQYSNVWGLWKKNNIDALARLRSDHLGYVLQTGGLMPFLNVRDNILLPRSIKGLSGAGNLDFLTQNLGISHLLHKPVSAVSVGERQRVSIARALIHEPTVVLADEPTAALDPYTADDVLNLLVKLSENYGVTLLVSSHDWERMRAHHFTELALEVQHTEQGILSRLSPPAGSA